MWNKPWKIKEGFAIGIGLIVVGVVLQLAVGPVAWDAFAWPVNGISMAAFLAATALIYSLRKRVYALQFLGTNQAAIPAMALAVVLTIVMGLTIQKPDGTWFSHMLSFWPFVLVYVLVALILGQTVVNRAMHFKWKRDMPFMLNHLGLLLAMTTATLGNADVQRLKMITVEGQPECRAVADNGLVKTMPMSIELKKFMMETYDDGSPKRFASAIKVVEKSGRETVATIDVNKSIEVQGWKIYQYGYDTSMGAESKMSILELVSDPWLPLVYAGFYIMLAGAAWMLLTSRPKFAFVAAILAVGAVASYFMLRSLHSKPLMPALQSPWFAPHVIVYMFCYGVFGVVTVMALYQLITRKLSENSNMDKLVYVGLALMTVGMLFGALWAKEAWGHYWNWDPKETWAAITWFAYLVYIHYRRLPNSNQRLALGILVVSFVLLQMCWWGINYLPSAQGISVHTYN